MKAIQLTIIFSIVFVASALSNGFEFNARCKSAYEQVFQLNLKQAEKLLQEEKSSNPENACRHYIQNQIDFLRAFISEEPANISRLKTNTDIQLLEIEKVNSKIPWKNLARSEIYLRLAVVKLKSKEYLSSGYYLRRSFKLLEGNQQQFPNFFPNQKPLGFLHAIIGAVPENYKWVANLVGMHGTIKQGAGELDDVMRNIDKNPGYNFMKEEVGFIQIFISTHLEKNYPEAISLLKELPGEQGNKSALRTFIEANTYLSAGNFVESKNTLDGYRYTPGSYPVYYLDYMKGMLLLNNLDTNATTYLKRYVDLYKGNSFIKSAFHKLALIDLIQGDEIGYKKNLEMVISRGNDFTDEDKQALKEALSNEKPNVILLKSRLLFDGGNYNEALSELAGKPNENFQKLKDQIEFSYRLARIFDKKNQLDKAIYYYTNTYENGKNEEWYFAANAALLLGNLYENTNNKKAAIEWYKKCLALRNHEYQNSIDQKAEAGLNRN